jgi:OOP family OmpA-OmpF porin
MVGVRPVVRNETLKNRTVLRGLVLALAACALAAPLGCGSAYQATNDQELRNLEADEAARQKQAQQEAAERAAADSAAAAQDVKRYHAAVYFNVGSSMVYEDGYRELLWFIDKLKINPSAPVEIKGYADSSGFEGHNQLLSEQRADNVKRFLIQHGISEGRITTAGYSSNFPDEPNDTAKGRSRNRRVEVRVP